MFIKCALPLSASARLVNKRSLRPDTCKTFLYLTTHRNISCSRYCLVNETDDLQQNSNSPLEFLSDVRRLKLVTFNDSSACTTEQHLEDVTKLGSMDFALHRPLVAPDDPLVQRLFLGITSSQRSALAQGITLIESVHPFKKAQGQALVREILEHCRKNQKHALNSINSFRIGLSGPPGAGKSTHIETLGKMLTGRGHKVAVLAVDPSSSTCGGSLLGDKTRMSKLAVEPNAYIRPSPNSGNLGGVTRVTSDAIILCEGAGYDVIIVETVGVGQSEFAVADMVDLFELLLPPAAGDELQGIKRGIVEVADMVVINKNDGDLIPAARRIHMEYLSAMKFMRPKTKVWKPCVLRVSSVSGEGMEEMWAKMNEYRSVMTSSGELERLRRRQHVRWMHNHIHNGILSMLHELPSLKKLIPDLEVKVEKNAITPGQAADKVLRHFMRLVEGSD